MSFNVQAVESGNEVFIAAINIARKQAEEQDSSSRGKAAAKEAYLQAIFNAQLRDCFATELESSLLKVREFQHIANTRRLILEAASKVKSQNPVIVVFGAQYTHNTSIGFVEPLEKLVATCKRLYLVDNDEYTLKGLTARLNDRRVVPVKRDLSFHLYECIQNLIADEANAILEKDGGAIFIKKMHRIYESAIFFHRNFNLSMGDFFQNGDEKADLCISSLVGTELFSRIDSFVLRFFSSYNKNLTEVLREYGMSKSLKIKSQLSQVMQITNVKNMFSMTQPGGVVYLADTVSRPYSLSQAISNNTLATENNAYCKRALKIAKIIFEHAKNDSSEWALNRWFWALGQSQVYNVWAAFYTTPAALAAPATESAGAAAACEAAAKRSA